MRLEVRKYLYDIQRAVDLLTEFTAGKVFEDYARDAMLRAAVERKFEVIGEALAQLVRTDPVVTERVSEYRRIIAFRNLLIHGYADIDDRLVWDILDSKLPTLRGEIAAMLEIAGGNESEA